MGPLVRLAGALAATAYVAVVGGLYADLYAHARADESVAVTPTAVLLALWAGPTAFVVGRAWALALPLAALPALATVALAALLDPGYEPARSDGWVALTAWCVVLGPACAATGLVLRRLAGALARRLRS
jgi:hypothetical protein